MHPEMRKLYFNGFLAPTLAIHPTYANMAVQCQIIDGKLSFNREVLEEDNTVAFGVATATILVTIYTMNKYFSLDSNKKVEEMFTKSAAINTSAIRK